MLECLPGGNGDDDGGGDDSDGDESEGEVSLRVKTMMNRPPNYSWSISKK
jgi:hypothetical protein